MKKIFILILFTLSNVVTAQNLSNDVANDSTKNLFLKSNSFEGYQFIILMVDNLPILKVEFVDGVKNSNGKFQVKMENVLSIRPEINFADEKVIANELVAMKSFVPAKTLEAKSFEPSDGKLMRFNAFDQNNIIRVSQWFDKRTFFRMKSAVFDESGNLLYFNFYSHLDFDKNLNDRHSEKTQKIKLEDFLKKHNTIKFKNISDIENFCNIVYQEEIQKEPND